MSDYCNLLLSVLTIVFSILVRYLAPYFKQKKEAAAASMESAKVQGYIAEIETACADAVCTVNQIYVDALKQANSFDGAAQKAAAQKALQLCQTMISQAAQEFIETVYGDLLEYLMTKIESEVRKQKLSAKTSG